MLWIVIAAALSSAADNGVDVDQGKLIASIDANNEGAVESVMKRTSYAADLRSPERAAVIVRALMRETSGAVRCRGAAATAIAAAGFTVTDEQFTMAATTCPALLSALWTAASAPALLMAAQALLAHIGDDDGRTDVEKAEDFELLRGAALSKCGATPAACPLVDEISAVAKQAALAGEEALRQRVQKLPGATVVDKVYGALASDTIDADVLRPFVMKMSDKDLTQLAKRAKTALLTWCGSADFGPDAPQVARRWVTALQPFDQRCSDEGSTLGASCTGRLELSNVGPTCADEQRAFLAKRLKKMKASDAVEVWDTTLLRDQGDRGPQVTLALHYKNKTPQRVIGVLVTVTIKNAFGRVAFTNTFEDEVVVAADSAPRNERVWVFRDNRYIPNEPYDKLWQMAEDGTATITVSVKKVVFDDGLVLSK